MIIYIFCHFFQISKIYNSLQKKWMRYKLRQFSYHSSLILDYNKISNAGNMCGLWGSEIVKNSF